MSDMDAGCKGPSSGWTRPHTTATYLCTSTHLCRNRIPELAPPRLLMTLPRRGTVSTLIRKVLGLARDWKAHMYQSRYTICSCTPSSPCDARMVTSLLYMAHKAWQRSSIATMTTQPNRILNSQILQAINVRAFNPHKPHITMSSNENTPGLVASHAQYVKGAAEVRKSVSRAALQHPIDSPSHTPMQGPWAAL